MKGNAQNPIRKNKMQIRIHNAEKNQQLSEEQLTKIYSWACSEINLEAESIDFIFVYDSVLKDMHDKYLNDPTFTDVITFNLGEGNIEGEIYISVDRARDQAPEYNVSFPEEIYRLGIHGLLHLKGYDDNTEKARIEMKAVENDLVDQIKEKFL